MIKPGAKIEEEMGLEALTKYVSVVSSGGTHSPFVKEVIVYHNNPDFEQVDVVDTGINDPNVMRTKVTTDWIHKADAVIYVSYAGRPAKADKEFITTHLGEFCPNIGSCYSTKWIVPMKLKSSPM